MSGGRDEPRAAPTGVPSRPRRTPVTAWPLLLLVRGYQVTLRPFVGGHCRFHPTCSDYAIEALRTHGALRGGWLTVRRLARCHPWGGCGFDPVPEPPEPPEPRTSAARPETDGARTPASPSGERDDAG